ncbi:hypothetical protein ACFL2Q_06435 [Thermodesulfobacteriota bacterium]
MKSAQTKPLSWLGGSTDRTTSRGCGLEPGLGVKMESQEGELSAAVGVIVANRGIPSGEAVKVYDARAGWVSDQRGRGDGGVSAGKVLLNTFFVLGSPLGCTWCAWKPAAGRSLATLPFPDMLSPPDLRFLVETG